MSLHLELAEWLATEFGPCLDGAPQLMQDALIVSLTNGVRLEVRYAATDAYAFGWCVDGRQLAIDTAPVHADLATRPNHLHGADGGVHADPLTRCGADPKDNLRALIDALLADPLLAAG
ncbi:hypothetical protein G3580_16705 [Nitrogeniibacter mangrovi]|uniref:Uncharacterized protein n=1 Tax=Nitrogeniibacter mangrovi TaxID=2016596 RepID=A0A6C1B6X6_9RHOO|nr:hypothetical protein [Nitrogeniibacter mangrovi]QID19113.1 hypothetical protein G3580_16705 [Nitrogeniibacter mangrovi]